MLPGFNDLSTTHPELAAQWHQSNVSSPFEVTYGCKKKFTWFCSEGHTWISTVKDRSVGKGCPSCAPTHNPSPKVELAIFNALGERALHHKELAIRWGKFPTVEVDFLLGILVIEYDGMWHNKRFSKDVEKTELLLNNGYRVLRLRQKPLALLDMEHSGLIQLSVNWSLDVEKWKALLSEYLE